MTKKIETTGRIKSNNMRKTTNRTTDRITDGIRVRISNSSTAGSKCKSRDIGKMPIRILALLTALALTVSLFAGCGSDAGSADSAGNTENISDTADTEVLSEGTELIGPEETESTESSETEEDAETETEAKTESDTSSETETADENVTESDEDAAETAASDSAALEGYTFTSLSKTMYVKKSVNVRSLPSTDGEKLGSLNKSDSVAVTGQCNETGWYRIIYNGKVGYCSNNYLSSSKPSSGSSSGSGSSSCSGSSGSSSGSSGSGSTIKTGYTQAELQAMAEEVIDLVNKERAAVGLDELIMDEGLMEAAQIRAEEQGESLGHTRPDGRSYDTVLEDLGIEDDYMLTGENMAAGYTSPEAVMEGWMNSSGHKGNILFEDYHMIGVGVYYDSNTSRLCWIQFFGEYDSMRLCALHDTTGTHKWMMDVAQWSYTYSHSGINGSGEMLYTIDLEEGQTYYECIDCGKLVYTPDGGSIIWYHKYDEDGNYIGIYDYETNKSVLGDD